jgi:serine/threonine protein phosphatase PrpC
MENSKKTAALLTAIHFLNEQGAREYNDDSIFPPAGTASGSDQLFMVCDGVGGSATGHVASGIICQVFADYFNRHLACDTSPDAAFIRNAQFAALDAMNNYVEANPQSAGMGSTLTLAHINQNGIFIAWCGDSRVYHVRDGRILFCTTDHSLVQELVRRGDISQDEADKHPQRNVILRSLTAGAQPSTIETHQITDLKAGDFILLCTDGLLENIREDTLQTLLRPKSGLHFGEAMNNIAYGRTNDNYSMYLLELGDFFSGIQPPADSVSASASKRSKTVSGIWKLFTLLLLSYFLWFYFDDSPSTSSESITPVTVPDTTQPELHDSDTIVSQSKFRRLESEKKILPPHTNR